MVGTSRAAAVRGEPWVRGPGRGGQPDTPSQPRARALGVARRVRRAGPRDPRPPAQLGMTCVSAEALPLEVAFWHVSVLFVDAEDFAFLTLHSHPKLKKFGGFLSYKIRGAVFLGNCT